MAAPLFVLASVTFFSLGASATMTFHSDKTTEALLKDMVQSWEEYKRLVLALPGPPRSSHDSSTVELREYPGCGLVIVTPRPDYAETRSEEVYGFNRQYSFVLERKRGKNWFVKRLSMNKVDWLVQHNYDDFRESGLTAFKLLFLERLVKHRHFRVIAFKEAPESTSSLMSMDFECPNQFDRANPKDYMAFQAGTIVLDRDRYWCPVRAVMRGAYPDPTNSINPTFEYRYEMKYEDGPGGIPLLVMVTFTGERRQRDGKAVSGSTTINLDWTPDSRVHQERDFTLSAFGLPEPPGVTWERPTPWWLYGIIICFSLIILSGILYRVAARWRTQAAKPQTR